MSVSYDQTGSAEFDHSEGAQFEISGEMSGLEGYDFNDLAMPNFAVLETSPAFDVMSTHVVVQSPHLKSPQPSPRRQPRRASVVSVRRRSSNGPNQNILSLTLEDPNGRKCSWDVNFDNSGFDAWCKSLAAGHVLNSTQPQIPMQLSHEPQPSMFLSEQLLSPSTYMPAIYPNQQNTVPYLPFAQEPLLPTTQMDPILSSPPVDRSRRLSASVQGSPLQAQRPATVGDQQDQQKARKRPRPTQQHAPQRMNHGIRPTLPDDIAPFVNPHHLPDNNGRVPDMRGNKDTTVANDYYYSISKLDNLELPESGQDVSYNGVEFDPGLYFTADGFLEYLQCASQRPNRQPILRIQIQPSQYNHRYKRAGQSFKCRFIGCPDKRGTILKGQARVCISEFNDEHGDWLNPFHNAGYVHLFCLEQQTNFIELCQDHPGITIVPETRSLAHEPPATTNMRLNNPMILNDVEQAVVSEWLTEMGTRWNNFKFVHRDTALRPKFDLAQDDTLTYRLTKAHMDNRVLRSIQKKRKLDAGGRVTAHLDEHVGDVNKQVALQKKMKKQPPPKKKSTTGKHAQDSPSPEPAAKRRRATPPPLQSPPHQVMPSGDVVQAQPAFLDPLNGGYELLGPSHLDVDGFSSFQPPSQQKASDTEFDNAIHIPANSPPSRRSSPRSRRAPPSSLVLSPRGVGKRRSSAKKMPMDAAVAAELWAILNETSEFQV